MRIAIVSATFDEKHGRRRAILEGLREAGHDCKFFALNIHSGVVKFIDEATVIDGCMDGKSALKKKSNFKKLKNLTLIKIAAFKPNCIVCMEPESLFVGAHFKQNKKVRFIYDVQEFHGHTTQANYLNKLWIMREERRAAPLLDALLVLSEPMKVFYRKRIPSSCPIHIVSNEISHWPKKLIYSGYLHESAQVKPETNILLYHGYLTYHRGLNWLADFSKTLPNHWHAVMMGWGELEAELRDRQHSHLSVIPPVPQEDLLSTLSGARLGTILYDPINLNHIHSTPNKLYEYPLAGVPILAEPLPDISAIVMEHKIGWLYKKTGEMNNFTELFNKDNEQHLLEKSNNCLIYAAKIRAQTQEKNWISFICG